VHNTQERDPLGRLHCLVDNHADASLHCSTCWKVSS